MIHERTPASRIVSLIPSSTEIVCALGFEEQLVGRSHECDYPESVASLPACTEPKFADGTSYEIDARVRAILQEGLSVYRVDADMLRRLRPDFIVTQTQCEVCAASLSDVEEAVCQWVETRPSIVSLESNALADIWNDMRRVASALGVGERGDRLVAALRERMARVSRQAAQLVPRPSVVCIEWIEPLMGAGNWMPELVEMAGGLNLLGEAGEHARWVDLDELVEADPDVVVVLPCGFGIGRTRSELPALTRQAGWDQMRAVSEGRVYLAEGNQYFNRPGPRVVEALEIMAEILHPEVFDFGHRGTGWEPL